MHISKVWRAMQEIVAAVRTHRPGHAIRSANQEAFASSAEGRF
jgi:hypothetical protein